MPKQFNELYFNMKEHFVVTQTISQTEIPDLLRQLGYK